MKTHFILSPFVYHILAKISLEVFFHQKIWRFWIISPIQESLLCVAARRGARYKSWRTTVEGAVENIGVAPLSQHQVLSALASGCVAGKRCITDRVA